MNDGPTVLRQLRRRLRRNPALRRLQTAARLSERANPFLVLAPPKTGSTTIEKLARAATGRPLVKLHSITPAGVAWRRRMRASAGFHSDIPELQDADYFHGLLAAEPDRRWDVITTVREPVARSISAFFHVGRAWGNFDPESDAGSVDLDALVERLLAWPLHPMSCHWVRWELEILTGIDFLAAPFDHPTGYQLYENERFRVLIVRAEDIDRTAPEALQAFFGSSPPVEERQMRANQARNKAYAGLYETFMAKAKLPVWFVDALQGTPEARHFYRRDELDETRRRWTAAPEAPNALALRR